MLQGLQKGNLPELKPFSLPRVFADLQCPARLKHYSLILLVAILTALPSNHLLPLLDRDEPRFIQATREMAARGEWLVPYFNGTYRFDKPIMSYWLMRGALNLLGDNEFAARFCSVLSSFLVALLIYEFTRKHISTRASWLASCGWLTCFQVLLHGKLALADMPMVLAVTFCQIALYKLLVEDTKQAKFWRAGLYIGLAFGFLSKGPIALFCPLLSLALFRFVFWRQRLDWQKLKPIQGMMWFLFLVSCWAIPAFIKTDGLFWQIGLQDHVLQRGIKPFNGRLFKPFYYLPTAFLSLFPWIAFAGSAWLYLRNNWNPTTAYLSAWALAPYILFSFYATQLPHYVLPAFPALLIILACGIDNDLALNHQKSWFFWIVSALAASLLWIAFSLAQNEPYTDKTLPIKTAVYALISIFLGLLLAALFVKNKFLNGAWLAILIISSSFVCLGKSLRAMSIAVQLEQVFQTLPPEAEHIYNGFEEPSLVYYSNAHWGNAHITAKAIAKPGARLYLLLTKEIWLEDYLASQFPRLIKSRKRQETRLPSSVYTALLINGYRYKPIHGLNLARISWVETEVWFRP
ncbi:MAG: glycosyltransferase family 39 protein [Methylococcaceae bacterium]|jgi:4-amino-4-deoxy-L-arabinose transferase-like glycosyltransferase